MTTEELKGKSYDELVQLHQDGTIGWAQFVLAQEELASYFTTAMYEYGLEINDENAQNWLQRYEENELKNDEGAEEECFKNLK